MMTILEHVIPIGQAAFTISVHAGGRVLSVAERGTDVVLVVLEDTDVPTHDYPFVLVEGGVEVSEDVIKERFVASFDDGEGTLVHLFQAASEASLEV